MTPNFQRNDSVTRIVQKPDGRSFKDVKLVAFQNSKMEVLPWGFEKFFEFLEAILVVNAGLRQVEHENLRVFPLLRFLQFKINRIEILKNDLFTENTKLEFIDFSNNRLKYVGPTIFDNLQKLSSVNFLGNSELNFTRADTIDEVKTMSELLKQEFSDDVELSIARREFVCKALNDFDKSCQSDLDECKDEMGNVDARKREIKELKRSVSLLSQEKETLKKQNDLLLDQIADLNKNCNCGDESPWTSSVQWIVIIVLIGVLVSLVAAVAFAIVKFVTKE